MKAQLGGGGVGYPVHTSASAAPYRNKKLLQINRKRLSLKYVNIDRANLVNSETSLFKHEASNFVLSFAYLEFWEKTDLYDGSNNENESYL